MDTFQQWQYTQATTFSATTGTEPWTYGNAIAEHIPRGAVVLVPMAPQTTIPNDGIWIPELAHWPTMPTMHTLDSTQQRAAYLPACPPIPSSGAPCLNLDAVFDQHLQVPDSSDEFALCTPEITPRCATVELTPEIDRTIRQLLTGMCSQVESQQAENSDAGHMHLQEQATFDQDDPEDAFSEYGDVAESTDNICWDFDIHAALLIRAQRDPDGYASSTTSTAVSRSSRPRRGRRHAKAKVTSSMAILESPPKDELLVTEERKNELIRHLEAGGDQMHKTVSGLIGSALRMSLEPFGCRVMQLALEVASPAQKEALVSEFHGNVRLMVSSPHGNFVVQKVIEVFPVRSAGFIAEELATVAVDVAQHRFGCRVLSRLVEHHLGSKAAYSAANDVVDELLLDIDQLIRHNFARHVLELILEHGSAQHRKQIAGAVCKNVFYYSKNRCASYVIEKALDFCEDSDKCAIAEELLADPEKVLVLAMHECGMHALKAVVKSRTEYAEKAKHCLLAESDAIKSSKFGKRLLEEV